MSTVSLSSSAEAHSSPASRGSGRVLPRLPPEIMLAILSYVIYDDRFHSPTPNRDAEFARSLSFRVRDDQDVCLTPQNLFNKTFQFATKELLWSNVPIIRSERIYLLTETLKLYAKDQKPPCIRTLMFDLLYYPHNPNTPQAKTIEQAFTKAELDGLYEQMRRLKMVGSVGGVDTIIISINDGSKMTIPLNVISALLRFKHVQRLRVCFPRNGLGFNSPALIHTLVSGYPKLDQLRFDGGWSLFGQDEAQRLAALWRQPYGPTNVSPATAITYKELFLVDCSLPVDLLQLIVPLPAPTPINLTTLVLHRSYIPDVVVHALVASTAATLEKFTLVTRPIDPLQTKKHLLADAAADNLLTEDGRWDLDLYDGARLPVLPDNRIGDLCVGLLQPHNTLRSLTIGGPWSLSPAVLKLMPSSIRHLRLLDCPNVRPTAPANEPRFGSQLARLQAAPFGIAARDIVNWLKDDVETSSLRSIEASNMGEWWPRLDDEIDEHDERQFARDVNGRLSRDLRPFNGYLGKMCKARNVKLVFS